jgi:hypothetical protein
MYNKTTNKITKHFLNKTIIKMVHNQSTNNLTRLSLIRTNQPSNIIKTLCSKEINNLIIPNTWRFLPITLQIHNKTQLMLNKLMSNIAGRNQQWRSKIIHNTIKMNTSKEETPNTIQQIYNRTQTGLNKLNNNRVLPSRFKMLLITW